MAECEGSTSRGLHKCRELRGSAEHFPPQSAALHQGAAIRISFPPPATQKRCDVARLTFLRCQRPAVGGTSFTESQPRPLATRLKVGGAHETAPLSRQPWLWARPAGVRLSRRILSMGRVQQTAPLLQLHCVWSRPGALAAMLGVGKAFAEPGTGPSTQSPPDRALRSRHCVPAEVKTVQVFLK